MGTIPFDSTIALLREWYPFIASRCDAAGTDLLTTRLMLRRVTLLRGAEAAQMFYDGRHLTRQGAMPVIVQHLLQDEGSVQSLDGAAAHNGGGRRGRRRQRRWRRRRPRRWRGRAAGGVGAADGVDLGSLAASMSSASSGGLGGNWR